MKNINISKQNPYKNSARHTGEQYRKDLSSWQLPAIQEHIETLNEKVFLDIGAGTIIPGEHFEKIGSPDKYYAQDINLDPLAEGIEFLKSKGVDTSIFTTLVSDDFDFSLIEDGEVDVAWSNSLFSSFIYRCNLLLSQKIKSKNETRVKLLHLNANTTRQLRTIFL